MYMSCAVSCASSQHICVSVTTDFVQAAAATLSGDTTGGSTCTSDCGGHQPTVDPMPTEPSFGKREEGMEPHCDSLIMCIVTTLNEGLRNGGGIGDVLRKPSSKVRMVWL